MKSFFNFLTEARQTKASTRAKELGLTGDGKGNWVDKAGNIIARTEGGKLVFVQKKGGAQRQDPEKVGQYKTPEQQVQRRPSTPEEDESQVGKDEGDEGVNKGGNKEGQTLTLVFGRFNPPTIGHKKLLDNARQVAADGDLKVYPSRSFDPKKNPLDPTQKTDLMRKMFPDHEESIVNDESVKTIFDALKLADNEGYSNIKIVVGSDRVAEFDNLAQKYNGDLYDFEEIETISAGQRDDEAEDVSGMSASKLRKAAAENDFESFRKGIPDNIDDKAARQIMNTVRKGMQVATESWNLWEIAPKFDWKNLRENYVTGKIFKIGDLVENLNTGLIGKVIRRGTNYLICVTEENIMFKSWIRDLMEAKEIEVPSNNLKSLTKKAINRKDNNIDGFVDKEDEKVGPYGAFIPQSRNLPKNFKENYQEKVVDNKKRTSGKPNTLVGTTGYFKYAVDMTPGFEKGDKTNLQPGGKPYKGPKSNIREFINRYKIKNK